MQETVIETQVEQYLSGKKVYRKIKGNQAEIEKLDLILINGLFDAYVSKECRIRSISKFLPMNNKNASSFRSRMNCFEFLFL